ncbi:YbcC family protein [Stappia stellulata]|uniref:YbcC family protein n=1 Tax=Stappia stellulata TaxID=71235 RepID=UPI000423CA5C|nr:DUF2309 domain-containing protein [Stappia stellulata]
MTAQTKTLVAAEAACARVAPVWPLQSFVAVNPYLGMADLSLPQAALRLSRVAGARTLQPRGVYLAALEAGEIAPEDLLAARAEMPGGDLPADATSLIALAHSLPETDATPLPTLVELAGEAGGRTWNDLVVERISAYAATAFDTGQAAWARPVDGLYAGWLMDARIDRTPDLAGLTGLRAQFATLPETAAALIEQAGAALGLEGEALELYFHRLLMSVGGWAAVARHAAWQAGLEGRSDDTPLQLLAIRLAWELALLRATADTPAVVEGWKVATAAYAASEQPARAVQLDCLLQTALERADARRLARDLEAGNTAAPVSADAPARPGVQAVFCIDVRSEVYRRSLESVAPQIATLGFAGFFGFAISYKRKGDDTGSARCPVLLAPQAFVCEGGAAEGAATHSIERVALAKRMASAWSAFKLAAVSSFAFVETAGLAYLGKLASDGFGRRTRPDARLTDAPPALAPSHAGSQATGLPLEQRIAAAEGALRGMSLTDGFARIVFLVGHGATSRNNPHAHGLDCGACGGQSGEANARVAAAVLNDPQVRKALAERGIALPEDTVAVAGLHDTTTDRVAILDAETVPASHADDLARLGQALEAAGQLTRAERALRIAGASETDIASRAADWAQVRPEWGLAGCSAFIAAPRARTMNVDLGGRAFLHTYDWRADEGFGVLEVVMTAPMVVASWINLQYYGSSVDQEVFGSGNKVLHNVVGGIGVLEGGGGDLRVGLPFQSLHDGEMPAHAPRRLSVVIAAPQEAILGVIARQAGVRQLLDSGWVSLFAMDDAGRISARYAGDLAFEDWTNVTAPAPALHADEAA